MIREERLSRIERRINESKYCSVNELAEGLGVSRATVRRDLLALDGGNRVRLARGGAVSIAAGTAQEPPYAVKAGINHEEKARIGRMAASLINRGETVILDSGTTALQAAAAMEMLKDVTVATNDVQVACVLARAKGIDVTVIGGTVRKGYFSTQGLLASHGLEGIHADTAFICADALDAAKGCMITNDAEVMVKQRMLAAASRKIVLCDHSKFGGVAFMRLCGVGDVDMVITGRELDPGIHRAFLEAGVNIVLV